MNIVKNALAFIVNIQNILESPFLFSIPVPNTSSANGYSDFLAIEKGVNSIFKFFRREYCGLSKIDDISEHISFFNHKNDFIGITPVKMVLIFIILSLKFFEKN